MLFFSSNAFFLHENCSPITNAVAFVNTVLEFWLSYVNIFFYKFIMLDGSFETKSSNENKNTIANM